MKRTSKAKRLRRRRKVEFSKILAVWAVLAATATGAAPFILAAFDKQTASDVTTTIFTACIGYLVTYAAKSFGEKVSRNRHGLDSEGNPINTTPLESTEDPGTTGEGF